MSAALRPGLEAGVFSGYASLFGETDLGGDVVAPGAFRASLRKRGPRGVRMLFQHDPAQPIGTWLDIAEDARGLRVVGKLNLDVARARELAALIRDGALDGLSIGYKTIRAARAPGGARKLLALDLWEISLVTFPMLPGARVGAKRGGAPSPNILAISKWRWTGDLLDQCLHDFGVLALRYNPDQPRDGHGRWTSGGGATDSAPGSQQEALVIDICVATGISRFTDEFGNLSYRATYECRDGREIRRTGQGRAPGLILDPGN